MKAVMLSIQPRHCENICTVVGEENGKPVYKKTIEVRKTTPKLETPFKCYIYETYNDKYVDVSTYWRGTNKSFNHACKKVIGEFVCDKQELLPESIIKTGCYDLSADAKRIVAESCLTREEVLRYMGDNVLLYGLHISDLKIYDQPKELGEFNGFKKCAACKVSGYEVSACIHDENCMIPVPLTRPFQSWGYVEELSE